MCVEVDCIHPTRRSFQATTQLAIVGMTGSCSVPAFGRDRGGEQQVE